MNNEENIKIPSIKGSLSAVINYPEGKSNRLAILCPGYLDSKDYKGLSELAKGLAEEGFTVVRFDPTGTWESEGDIYNYTMTQYLEDIRVVLEHMLKNGEYKDVLLGGHSRGGQMSILYAAQDPRISLVLGIMPSSGPIISERRDEWEKSGVSISQRDLPDDRNETKEFQVPFTYVLDRDKYNVIEDIKKIRVPIVLIAGELDDVVPPEDVKNLFENANNPKRFISIANIGYDYRLNDDEVSLVNEKIIEQLKSFI